MILWDVNLLLYAATPASTPHKTCRELLRDVLGGGTPFALSPMILSAVLRIATNPRVFSPPASPSSVFGFCAALREHPNSVPITPGPRHWEIFRKLVLDSGIRGSDTTDAFLAAIAMEHGCEWWSSDRGFMRFERLRWRNPLAE